MPDLENKPAGFVTFHHRKSGFFRVVHADGAWGNANAAGMVHLSFYSEHVTIPTSVTYPQDANGRLINNPTEVTDGGIEREMEVAVALSIPAAMQIRATLDTFINIAVQNMKILQQQTSDIKPHIETQMEVK